MTISINMISKLTNKVVNIPKKNLTRTFASNLPNVKLNTFGVAQSINKPGFFTKLVKNSKQKSVSTFLNSDFFNVYKNRFYNAFKNAKNYLSNTVDNILVKFPNIKNKINEVCSFFKNKTKSFYESVRKFVKEELAFANERLKLIQKKINLKASLESFHFTNKVQLNYWKDQYLEAKNLKKDKFKRLVEAVKSGSKKAIRAAKSAYDSANKYLKKAKDYLNMALKFFKESFMLVSKNKN